MKKKIIAEIAMECMFEAKIPQIDMGNYGLLDEIYSRCKKQEIFTKLIDHPMNRQAYIMSQLRKSKYFKRVGYIDYPGFGRGYARCAVLEVNPNSHA